MNTKEQLRNLFREKGMNPEPIRYNDSLCFYLVDVGVKGTDEQYLADIQELGSSEAVDVKVDTDALKRARGSIEGSEIDAGTIVVAEMMRDAHFKIEVQ